MRRPRPVIVKQQIDPQIPGYVEPGTIVEFRAYFLIPSRIREDGGELRKLPRPGFAYVVRGQFAFDRIDVEERVACRSRPKVGLPKGSAVSVIMNVPVEWIVIREDGVVQVLEQAVLRRA
jgi:hypothetical protein